MSSPSERPAAPRAAIHDIGYRPYAGPRLGELSVARSLYVTGLRNCYGLGRSTKSKVLPVLLFIMMLLPALIVVAVVVQAGLEKQPIPYPRYSMITQLVISVFVASQAPALVARDAMKERGLLPLPTAPPSGDAWEYPSRVREGKEAPKWKRMQESSMWESICTVAGR
ncbi:MAG TPA: hypothetical protein VIM19_07090 [Actinomycetes bacterium]